MQGETGENESVAPADERENPNFSFHAVIWLIRLAAVAYLAGMAYTLWQDEELQLRFLHSSIKALQGMARILGTWAIQAEMAYNEAVELLH